MKIWQHCCWILCLSAFYAGCSAGPDPQAGPPDLLELERMANVQREARLDASLQPMLTELQNVIGGSKVAIVGFYKDGSQEEPKVSEYLVPRIIRKLFEMGVRIMERKDLDMVLAELNLQRSVLFDPHLRKKTGQLLSADALIIGQVQEVTLMDYRLEAKLENVETGEVLTTASCTIPRETLPVRYGGK